MNSPIKTGIVGFGISAKVFHAPFLHMLDGYEIVSVVERNKEESKQEYPNVKVVRSIDELIEDESIELVVITTPNETHFPYAKRAIEAGKHVVLEKPFAISSDEAKQLVELAASGNRVLSVYQNRRYVSDFLTIDDILKKGLLGDIHEFIAHYDRYRSEERPNAWREKPIKGSGILYDLGPHLLDQVLYLFGLPDSITADIRMLRPHAQVDYYFEIWLHYDDKKITLHGSMLIREPGPRYLVHGTKGSFVKSGEDPQEPILRGGGRPSGPDWGYEDEINDGILHAEIGDQVARKTVRTLPGNYGKYYENLYQTIRHNGPLKEKPEHGYNTVRLIELAFESHHKKCTIECTGLIDIQYA